MRQVSGQGFHHRCGTLSGALLVMCALAATLFAGGLATAKKSEPTGPRPPAQATLTGQFLVAASGMRDKRFARTVIFMLRHDERGAMGLIVNRLAAVEPAAKLLAKMLGKDAPEKDAPEDTGRSVRLHYGGPVQPAIGIFLHSAEYKGKGTVAVTDIVSITTSADILRALAEGKGPAKGFLAMGHAGWAPGQLEGELKRKDWVTVPSDERLLFDSDMESKWRRAMEKRSIDL